MATKEDFEQQIAEHQKRLDEETRKLRAQGLGELEKLLETKTQELKALMDARADQARRRFDEGMKKIQRSRETGEFSFMPELLEIQEANLKHDLEETLAFNQQLLDAFIRQFQPTEPGGPYRTPARRLRQLTLFAHIREPAALQEAKLAFP